MPKDFVARALITLSTKFFDILSIEECHVMLNEVKHLHAIHSDLQRDVSLAQHDNEMQGNIVDRELSSRA